MPQKSPENVKNELFCFVQLLAVTHFSRAFKKCSYLVIDFFHLWFFCAKSVTYTKTL